MNPVAVDAPPADLLALYRRSLPLAAREPRLRGVIADTLATPGALTRLHLALLAGKLLGLPAADARSLAVAVEYFHTASLLLDDLPCMDDACERRGRPCAHVVHGPAATILGALAFINRAYALLWDALAGASPVARAAAARRVEQCLGCAGVLDGQSQDLHFADSDRTAAAAMRASLGKTVALLRLTLLTPALLAGAEARETQLLDRLAVYWGLGYQLADDFSDLRGHARAGKTSHRDRPGQRPNFVHAAGASAARARLARLQRLVHATWAALAGVRSGWQALAPLIQRFDALAAPALAGADEEPARRCA